jgi:hypothetical protein
VLKKWLFSHTFAILWIKFRIAAKLIISLLWIIISNMLAFSPLLVWGATVILWLGKLQDNTDASASQHSIRSAVILASICWGAGLALTTELLSLVRALTPVGVGLGWGTALCLLCLLGWRSGYFQRGMTQLVSGCLSIQKCDWLLVFVLSILSSALLLVLLFSPSGNTDSLHYHLSRVMHWAQNASLQHYATAAVQQLYNPIWAEEVILHLRLLWGNDRLAGLVQWGAMLASLVAITQIASELGVGWRGQWIAAAFAFSLPMGVLQSVSTQNDYVVAFWLLCVAWLCLRATAHSFSYLDALTLGLAVGLGLLTKGTFYPYVVPFGLWFLLVALRWAWQQPERTRAFQQTLISFGIITLSVILLNSGYWLRNLNTFDSPLGPSEWVSRMTSGQYNFGAFFASLIRNVAMNFATPSEQINSLIVQVLRTKLTSLDPRMTAFTLFWGWNHEDMAGNPLHVVLLAVALVGLLLTWKRVQDRRLWVYLAAAGGVFAMLALIVHFDLYGVRYQLPLFLLFAPLVGASLDLPKVAKVDSLASSALSSHTKATIAWRNRMWILTLLLLLAALPWVLFNRSRPLIALKEGGEPFSIPCQPVLGCTVGSILFEPPITSLFANHYPLRGPYMQMSEDLKSSGCQQLGLRIDSSDLEYLFWWLLDAPQSGVHLETLYTFPDLERYIDPAYKPCAIICTICDDRSTLHGLTLEGDYSNVKLFAGSGFTPEPGPKD